MKQKLRVFLTLLLCAVASVGWAEEVTYSMTPNQDNTGSTATTYITSLTEFTYGGVSWKMNQWNPSTLQVKTNQSSAASEFRFYNTSAFSGRITQVVITFSALTVSDASKLMFLGGTSEVTATTGGTAGTWNSANKTLTWTPGASDNFTYFAFYQNGKAASGTNYLAESDAIVVTYESSSSSAVATTTTIDASGITNTDVFKSTAAGQLTATVMAGEETISDATVTWSSSDESVATIEESTGEVTLVAAGIVTFKASYTGVTDTYKPSFATYKMTVTSSAPVIDYAELPFIWEGGASAALIALNGVTANGLGSDYASGNAPYLVKFDNTGDFIQVKTNGQPGKVSIDVKMIGGANTSSITVQGSSDGETFTNVQVLTISGSQNDELELESVKPFAADVRYVRLYFTKGSNIGVGAISIAMPSSDPVISAENVNIEYNTTSGSVEYEIVNPVEGGVISVTSDAEWLTFGETGVAFTATVNEAIDARTANVTLTYTYNSAENVTKEITVTQAGNPNAPGTQNNPFTVEQAIANTPASGTSAKVYIRGKVSAFYSTDGTITGDDYHRYYVSDDGTQTAAQLLVYNGNGLNNVEFSDANDLAIGDEVVICGGLTTFNEAPEVASGNYIYSLTRPEKPKHIAFFSINGEISSTIEVQEGESIEFPSDPDDIYGKTFVGWTDAEINGESDETPATLVKAANMGTTDITYFAVFANVSEEEGVVSLTIDGNVPGLPDHYGEKDTFSELIVEGTKLQIMQIYKNSQGELQWRAAGNTNGTGTMYNEDALNNIQSIILNYSEFDQNKNFTVKVGTQANPSTGDQITPTIDGLKYTFDCSSVDYSYFVVTNGANAGYLNSLVVNYLGITATYSSYCTTVEAPEVPAPTFDLPSGIYPAGTVVTITPPADPKMNVTVTYSFVDESDTWSETGANNQPKTRTLTKDIAITAKTSYKYDESMPPLYSEEVTNTYTIETIPVTIGSSATGADGAYYSSVYYSDKALKVPADVECLTYKVVDGALTVSKTYSAGDVIPADEAVVIKASASASGTVTFPVTLATADKDTESMLLGVDEAETIDEAGYKYYKLTLNAAKEAGTAGFYFDKNVTDGSTINAAAHKCYLRVPVDQTNGAKGFVFGEETDGIGHIEMGQTSNAEIYNLSGQRVNKAQKGIYIVNGKKVVIR
jgi:hypothetical protein